MIRSMAERNAELDEILEAVRIAPDVATLKRWIHIGCLVDEELMMNSDRLSVESSDGETFHTAGPLLHHLRLGPRS